jgi:hypothetical protein
MQHWYSPGIGTGINSVVVIIFFAIFYIILVSIAALREGKLLEAIAFNETIW